MTMTHAERAERRKATAAAAKRGLALFRLCGRFKVGPYTIYAACAEHGVRVPSNVDMSSLAKRHPFEVLAKLKAPGNLSGAQVARECGLSYERVRQIKGRARKLGLL